MGTLKEFFTSIYSELIMLTLIFLFFFQTINSFFTGVYALNFAIMGIGPYIILVFFLLSPFLLLIFKRDFPLSGLYITASFLLIARTCMLFISNTVAISIITGVGVAAFFIFYPTYYQWNIKTAKTPFHITMTQAIGLALGLSIGLKTLGSSFDYSTYGYGISIYVVFLLILLLMFPGFHFSSLQKEQKPLETGSFEAVEESPSQQPSFGIFFLISMGLYGIIAILWYALGYPSAFSRWSNASSVLLTIITLVSFTIFLVLLTVFPKILELLNSWLVITLNILLIGSLVVSAFFTQMNFLLIQQIFTYIAAAFSFVALLDFLLFSKELTKRNPTTRQLGGSFGISSVLFLITGFLLVSSFNYEWVPGTTFLRDRFYLIIIIVAILFIIPLIFFLSYKGFEKKPFIEITKRLPPKNRIAAVTIIGIFIVASSLGLTLNRRNPTYPPSPTELSIMTYNIHEGEDKYGEFNFQRVLATLKKTTPDIIGLQESEMGRICFGNNDIVRFLAEKLNMFIYYGPNTVSGTYGVATLSKYPIESARTYFLPSEGHSQRVILQTDIRIGSELITIYNAHLGIDLEERIPQAQYIEDFVIGATKTFFIGDYNTKDSELPYTYFSPPLLDAWLEMNPSGVNGTDYNGDTNRFPRRRIDYIFYTPDFTISQIDVLTWVNESDHWPVYGMFSL